MPTSTTKHADAWDRLVSKSTVTLAHAQADYEAVKDAYFRGRATGADLLQARVARCQAESLLVTRRAQQGAPVEPEKVYTGPKRGRPLKAKP